MFKIYQIRLKGTEMVDNEKATLDLYGHFYRKLLSANMGSLLWKRQDDLEESRTQRTEH